MGFDPHCYTMYHLIQILADRRTPLHELIHILIQLGCASATESTVKLMSGGRILCHL